MNHVEMEKSTFFRLDENIAAALAAGLPLILTFVPYVSYFAWMVPLLAVIFERKSTFVRFCAGEAAFASVILLISTALFTFINGLVNSGTPLTLIMSLCGMLTSIIRVVCAVIMIMVTYNGYLHKELNIPLVATLIKKIIKYNNT